MFPPPIPQERKRRPRAPHQLPPGRHKLPRQFVKDNQRERILDAVVDVVSLAGYAAMSVEEIIGAAGVSRRTFYDHFKGKDEAFLAALEGGCTRLFEGIRAASDANDTFAGGVRDCLAAFVQFVADEPRHADMLIVEVLAAGPPAVERRNDLMRKLTAMLRSGADGAGNTRRPPELTAETIIGGIYEVAYSRVLQGQGHELEALLPDLAYSVLQPYLGHERATLEAARPTGPATPGRQARAQG